MIRDIAKGEQIFTDYHDYGQIGMPELLRDYGFVEFYPQTFIFHDQHIAFIVDETGEQSNNDDNESNKLEVTWIRNNNGKRYWHPEFNRKRDVKKRNQTIEFLKQQTERLEQVCSSIQGIRIESNINVQQQEQQQHELSTTVKFCHDIMVAMEAALIDLGQLLPEEQSDPEEAQDEL